jgi:hypothetical protein
MLRCTADHTFCLETQARQIPESARTDGPTLQVGLYLALSHPASNSATCSAKWPLPNPTPVELSRLNFSTFQGIPPKSRPANSAVRKHATLRWRSMRTILRVTVSLKSAVNYESCSALSPACLTASGDTRESRSRSRSSTSPILSPSEFNLRARP